MRWPYSSSTKKAFAPGSYKSDPGKRIQPIFEPRFDGKTITLQKVGTKDVQEEIQSYEPYTDIAYMLHRLSVGDTSVLTKSTPVYGDFTILPEHPMDIVNYITSAESAFGDLSAAERGQYNNDWRVWVSSLFDAKQSASKSDSGSTSKDTGDSGSKDTGDVKGG